MIIRKKKVSKDKVNITNWNPWECEPSTFDWEYDTNETAYILEGKVKVITDNEEVEIGAGELVQFPKGLKCTWKVIKPIKKVYTFGNFDWGEWEKSIE